MYDDKDEDCGSGLSGAVWYQLGRWAEQDDHERQHLVDNLRARFSNSRPQGLINLDEYHNLMAWYRHALELEKQIKELRAALQTVYEDRNNVRHQRDAIKHNSIRMTSLFIVERELRRLAERGHATRGEYRRLAELQQAAFDEFMRTGELDTDTHEAQAIKVSVKLESAAIE